MSFRRAITYSVAINLFFLALCLIFGDLKFGAIDDYFMAARLTGALGTDYNPHLIFVNAIYGYVLLPLYHLFPKIGWYYIGEMFSVFLSFTVIGYVLLQRCGERWGAVLAALFTALFASDFYLVVQFTQCASILSAAGMLLFAYGIVRPSATLQTQAPDRAPVDSIASLQDDRWKRFLNAVPFILGVLLMLWGSVMRWQAFLMGMPFFCLCLLFLPRECWAARWRVITGLAVLFVAAFAMHSFDQGIYQAPEYAAFNQFQGPRVALGDNGNYNQNAVYEDAEELGLSGKDFHLLKDWAWYDTEAFSCDSLSRYTELIRSYHDNNETRLVPRMLMGAIGRSTQSPIFWGWLAFCVVIYFTRREKFLYLWGSFFVILSLMSYLLLIGRPGYRVESGFWLYAAVLAIPLFGRFSLNLPWKLVAGIVGIVVIANIYAYATAGEVIRDPVQGKKRTLAIEDSTDYKAVFDYIESNPQELFLLSNDAFMRFSHHRNPPYLAEPVGAYRRTVSFGYWTPYLPEVTQALADFGVTNPMKDVVHDNIIVINEGRLGDFLQRHYYDSVTVDTLKVIGEMSFYKYRLVRAPDTLSGEALQ